MQLRTDQIEDVVVVHLQGEALDAGNAKDFKSQVAPSIVPGARLVFELSHLKFVDSSGLGALLSMGVPGSGLGFASLCSAALCSAAAGPFD